LLAFLRPTPNPLRAFLSENGTTLSERFKAEYYREIWELSPDRLTRLPMTLVELDQSIAGFMRTIEGRYPSSAGYWFYGDSGEHAGRKHWTSQLLQNGLRKETPSNSK